MIAASTSTTIAGTIPTTTMAITTTTTPRSTTRETMVDTRYGLGAYDQGYEDGLFTGANDARRGQTFDPERSHFYKNGANGYNSSFGNKDIYQQAYRDGFSARLRRGLPQLADVFQRRRRFVADRTKFKSA